MSHRADPAGGTSRYCCYSERGVDRRPAFGSDTAPFEGPEGLAKLRELCREASEEDPELTLVIEDADASFEPGEVFDDRVVHVFGRLLREQWEAIDWNEIRERERWSAFPKDD